MLNPKSVTLKESPLNGYANDDGQVWTSPVTSLIDLLTQQKLFLFLDHDVVLSEKNRYKSKLVPYIFIQFHMIVVNGTYQ